MRTSAAHPNCGVAAQNIAPGGVISQVGVHIVHVTTTDPLAHTFTFNAGAIVVVGTGFAAVLASHGDGSVNFAVSGSTIVVSGGGQVSYRTLMNTGSRVPIWGNL